LITTLRGKKTRLKKENIPYDLYLEFLRDYEKEKKEIQKELTPGAQGVCYFPKEFSTIEWKTSVEPPE
jgi:hypothetical protein